MRKELKKKLLETYSPLFKPDQPPQFDCEDGWYDLLDEFFAKLMKMDRPPDFKMVSIKQKYGGLSVWGHNWNDAIYDMFHEVERESINICEHCGSRSKVRFITIDGWEQVACYPCRQMLKAGWSKKAAQFNEAEKLSVKAILEHLMAVCNEEMGNRFPGGSIKVVLQGSPNKCHIVVKDAEGRVYAA